MSEINDANSKDTPVVPSFMEKIMFPFTKGEEVSGGMMFLFLLILLVAIVGVYISIKCYQQSNSFKFLTDTPGSTTSSMKAV